MWYIPVSIENLVQHLDENIDHYTAKNNIAFLKEHIFLFSLVSFQSQNSVWSQKPINVYYQDTSCEQWLFSIAFFFIFIVGCFPPGFRKQECYFIFYKWLPLLYSLFLALPYAFDKILTSVISVTWNFFQNKRIK